MDSESSPYFFISSAGVPDSPKVSLVAMNSWGLGSFLHSTLEILSPNPPRKLCSSAETIHPVLFTESSNAFSSSGLMVWKFITSAKIFFSSKSRNQF